MDPQPSIRLFVKPGCGWCIEVIEWLDQHRLPHQILNVHANESAWREMIQLSGQRRAPVIEVDGQVLADFGADELEVWWTEQGFALGK